MADDYKITEGVPEEDNNAVDHTEEEWHENNDNAPLIRPNLTALQQKKKRFQLTLPEVPVFFFFWAMLTQYPVQQYWLYDHFSQQYGMSPGNGTQSYCGNSSMTNSSQADIEKMIQEDSNYYIMLTSLISNFGAIVPTLYAGPLTDKYGRKKAVYVALVGMLLNLLVNLCVYHFNWDPNFLCIGSVFQGITGNYGLLLAGCFGMVADITKAGKDRGFRVTTTEATLAVAQSLSTTVAGILVKEIGYVWPMIIGVVEVILALLFVFFLLPETLEERTSRPVCSKGAVATSMKLYYKKTPDKRNVKLFLYLLCFQLIFWCITGELNFNILYLLHEPFCWDKINISIFNGAVTLAKWVVSTATVVFVLKKTSVSEPSLGMVGCVSGVAGYLVKGLALNDNMIFAAGASSVLVALVGPMCRTMMSKAVPACDQGALFAGMSVLQMTVSASSVVTMGYVYKFAINDGFTGLPYVVMAGLVLLAGIFLWIVKRVERRWPQIVVNTEQGKAQTGDGEEGQPVVEEEIIEPPHLEDGDVIA